MWLWGAEMFGAFSGKEENNEQQLYSKMVNNRTVNDEHNVGWTRVNELRGGLTDH